MSQRAGTALQQFGYDRFGVGQAVIVPQTGAVEDGYVLGPGDEIVVSLRGQENNEIHTVVDRNGQVVLPRLSPIAAMGRSLGSFRADVEAAVRRAFVATSAFVSIGRVRQITVLVTGEVYNPGQRLVTGLSSAVDALLLSGGVKKTGSLRNIRIQRGGHEYTVDLYNVLTGRGGIANMRLADGDRIIVPALGRTVAVSGLVRRPGIFELGPGQRSITVPTLLALAGGEEVRASYRLSVLRLQPDGRSALIALAGNSGVIGDSEILFVQLAADQAINQATLAGGTGLAGRLPITTGTKLSDVLKAPGALGTEPYTLFGILARKDPRTLMRTLSVFTPVAVLAGREDTMLQSDDIIRVLSMSEMRFLTGVVGTYSEQKLAREEAIRNPASALGDSRNSPNSAVASVAAAGAAVSNLVSGQRPVVPPSNSAPGQGVGAHGQGVGAQAAGVPMQPVGDNASQQSAVVDQIAGQQRTTTANQQGQVTSQEGTGQGNVAANREVDTLNDLAQQLGVSAGVLTNFLLDHEVTLEGAVRGPGHYFVGSNVELRDLVQAAGGTVQWADESGVELITTAVDVQTGRSMTRRVNLPLRADGLANYIVKERDQFRFNQAFTEIDVGQVTVQGELRFTGTYELTRGEHLSDLLARAGGLTNTAYPYGTVFLRKSAAAVEREGYVRAANEVENQLIVAMTRVGNDKIDPQTFSAMQTFVSELRNQVPLGRISIVADPSVLAAKPEMDPLLEAGDVIYVPQRPSTISVLGQVMQPGSYPYRKDATLGDYIERAGGYARFADESQTFVVLPDGSARKIEKSWLSFDVASLPPGSAIVVPRDITPLDLRQTVIDVSQIFSQFAVAIASVAVLSKQ